MRLRLLAVYPLLYAVAFSAVSHELSGNEVLAPLQRLLVRILAVVGCFAAASAFERGDHLRRAWLLLGTGATLIGTCNVLLMLPPFEARDALVSALAILSNFIFLAGIWTLARSWRMAAIELPGGRLGSALVSVTIGVMALAGAGPHVLGAAKEVAAGNSASLVPMVSAVVDVVSFCLIAPLLLTAVALRGGLFSWPWALITVSQFGWLLCDVVALGIAGSAVTSTGFPLLDLFRGLASNYLFAAGMAQLLVVRQVRRAAG
jgi:hypothetical protein